MMGVTDAGCSYEIKQGSLEILNEIMKNISMPTKARLFTEYNLVDVAMNAIQDEACPAGHLKNYLLLIRHYLVFNIQNNTFRKAVSLLTSVYNFEKLM